MPNSSLSSTDRSFDCSVTVSSPSLAGTGVVGVAVTLK